jgi:hypothetical protein
MTEVFLPTRRQTVQSATEGVRTLRVLTADHAVDQRRVESLKPLRTERGHRQDVIPLKCH